MSRDFFRNFKNFISGENGAGNSPPRRLHRMSLTTLSTAWSTAAPSLWIP